MKKTKKLRELKLNVQTLRPLTPQDLTKVGGGMEPEETGYRTCSCVGGCMGTGNC